jgi:hypothetical protein
MAKYISSEQLKKLSTPQRIGKLKELYVLALPKRGQRKSALFAILMIQEYFIAIKSP